MTARELHRAWPEANIGVVVDAGHSACGTGITDELMLATDRHAGRDPKKDFDIPPLLRIWNMSKVLSRILRLTPYNVASGRRRDNCDRRRDFPPSKRCQTAT